MTLESGEPPSDTNYTSISKDNVLVVDPVRLGSEICS
jgi:hypothetical protein